MKTSVLYMSGSGNTEKVARAIAEALPGEVQPVAIGKGADPEDSELLFVGMPMHQFGAPEPVARFLHDACQGRRVALFVTHAAPEELHELAAWLDSCAEAAAGSELVGLFNCQGQVPPETRQSWIDTGVPMLVQFGEMAAVADGQPDEEALERARRFAAATLLEVEALAAR